ncbi:hypothetical protein [Methanobrevibacter sp.]|uniref:hypothetical protein n=1 Tax=Methanobrevibacter sp. TaxID=66852 RepID=UPI00388F4718
MLYLANEDYKLTCYDSLKQEVDLSGVTEVCYIVQKSPKMKRDNKSVVTSINIVVTALTGLITTSLIDGSTVTFVSASGTLTGNSQKNKIDGVPICLADENATILTINTSKCTKGKLTVIGSNTQSGATITDVCDIWISDAGQNKVRGD